MRHYGAGWGLPWLGVMAISASLAHVMTVAVAGGASAADPAAAIVVAQASADSLVTEVPGWSVSSPAIDRVSRDEACDTSSGRMLYVGLNSWIPAQPIVAPCTESVPRAATGRLLERR
jgi:hypothetical protein